MKLHLPKSLFVALMLVYSTAQAMTGWGSGDNRYCIGTEGETVSAIDARNRPYINLYADINADNYKMTASVLNLQIDDGAYINVATSVWGTGRNFETLNIHTISVTDEGYADLRVSAPNGVTIGSVDGVLGTVTNSGSLSIGSEAGTTILGGTITNTGTLSFLGTLNLAADATRFEQRDVSVAYNDTGNGFATYSGSFYLAKGVNLGLESISQVGSDTPILLDTTTEAGNTIFSTTQTDQHTYWVNQGTVVIGGDQAEIGTQTHASVNGGIAELRADSNLSKFSYYSGSIHISDGTTLTADADLSIPIITNLTGTGTLAITGTNVIQGGDQGGGNQPTTTTQFEGRISVRSGATLKIGDATDWMRNWSVNLDSLKSLDLDGGNIRFFGANSSVSTINVNQNATINSHQAGSATLPGLDIDKLNLNADLNVQGEWGSYLTVDTLTGQGNLNIKHNAQENSTLKMTIGSVESVGSITTGSNTELVLGTDENSTHNITHTINLGGTLSIQGKLNIAENLENYRLHEMGEISSWSDSGTDGYARTTGSTYYIAMLNGGSITNTAESLSAINSSLHFSDSGDLLFTAGDTWGATYHLNTKNITVGGADGAATAADALEFVVKEGRTLTIAGNTNKLTANQILSNTSGDGNIIIDCRIKLSGTESTQAGGRLTIAENAHLQIGDSIDQSASIASFSSVLMDGSTMDILSNTTTVNNLQTTGKGATIQLLDLPWGGALNLKGETIINGKTTLASSFKGIVNIDQLSGTADLEMISWHNAYSNAMTVNIDTISTTGGKIIFCSNTDAIEATLNVDNIQSMTGFENRGAITRVNLGTTEESVLNLSQTITIGGHLKMQGTINLGSDMTSYKLKELGTVSSWSDGEDGFAISTNNIFTLVDMQDGATLSNTAEELANLNKDLFVYEDGDIVFVGGELEGTTYFVRTKDITVGGSTGIFSAQKAMQLNVEEGRTLTVCGDLTHITAADIVASSTGKGNLILRTNETNILADNIESELTGTLTIAGSNTTLKTGAEQYASVNLKSYSAVVLDEGTFDITAGEITINNLQTTTKGGKLHITDMGSGSIDAAHLAGLTTLNGDLQVTNSLNGQIQIDKLTGAGSINIKGFRHDTLVLNILDAAEWQGNLNMDLAESETLNKLKVSVADGWKGTASLSNAKAGKIDLSAFGSGSTLSLENNALSLAVDIYNESNIDSKLILKGDNTINDGSPDSAYNFNGTVSGTGRFAVQKEMNGRMNFNFQGDTSQWTGQAEITEGTHNITFKGNATTINNSRISATGTGTLNLNIDNTADVVVNSILTHGADAALHLAVSNSHNTTFTANVEASTITTSGNGRTEFQGDVQAEELSLNAATLFTGSVKGDVQANTTGSLLLNNSLLSITGSLTADVGAIDLSEYIVSMPFSGTELPELLTFNLVQTTGNMNIFNTGSVDAMNLGLAYDTDNYKAYLTVVPQSQVGNLLVLNLEQVPEPATTTLSLLALSGLALRRRRQ